MPKLRVAIVTTGSVWGGLEAHTLTLADALEDDGCEVVIACIGEDTFRMYRQAAEHRRLLLIEPQPGSGLALRAWTKALRNVPGDVAIFQKGTFHTGSLSLDLALKLRFGRYVAIEHLEAPSIPVPVRRRFAGGLITLPALWLYQWRALAWLRSTCPSATICVSDAVRQRLIDEYGLPSTRFVTVHNGVDVSVFTPHAERRTSFREKLGILPNAFVFGFVGRLVRIKGVDLAVRAFAQAQKQVGKPFHLVIVGDGPERADLERLVRECGIATRTHFVGFEPKPWEIYPGIDCIVLPSRVEALGLAAIEAMACGCEVIASAVGGIPEVLSSPTLGTKVRPDDLGELTNAMCVASMRDIESRERLCRHAREHVFARFDRRQQVRRILSLLTEDGTIPEPTSLAARV
ncbi:MAG: glycosyltransferase family 4 protein [Vicinamibacterales bacterium]